MEKEQCCWTCRFREYGRICGDWLCMNEMSENWMDFIGYDDCCEEWEEREN